jgi:molybdopterin synthase sulfur carrier subunit
MNLNLLYFASVKETLDCGQEKFTGDVVTVADLVAQLCQRNEPWQSTLAENSVLVAVNQTISDRHTVLSDGDEVAFFPPVTGG